MSRAAKRNIKKAFQKDIVEFLRIQNHFLPSFTEDLGKVKDPRKIAYTDYDIESDYRSAFWETACMPVNPYFRFAKKTIGDI